MDQAEFALLPPFSIEVNETVIRARKLTFIHLPKSLNGVGEFALPQRRSQMKLA